LAISLADTQIDVPVFLAPLAGITDLPFRDLVSGFGAGSQEMVQAKPGVREKAELGFDSANTAVQLAGREAHWMAEAARMVAANGAKIIDINMGCPAKKVVSGYSGSALLRDLDHALTLIEAVVEATELPVTLKTRLGWDDALLQGRALPEAPSGAALIDLACGHYEAMQAFYGPVLGPRVSRKHMGWYMDHVGTPAPLRREVLTAKDPAAVLRLLEEALSPQEVAA